jgi:hypothetical protein
LFSTCCPWSFLTYSGTGMVIIVFCMLFARVTRRCSQFCYPRGAFSALFTLVSYHNFSEGSMVFLTVFSSFKYIWYGIFGQVWVLYGGVLIFISELVRTVFSMVLLNHQCVI